MAKGTLMSDFDVAAERYLAAWNATNPARRSAAVAEAFAEDVRYVDPLAAVEGREALDGLIGAVQAQFPGFVFSAGGPVDAHHEQARFTWHLGPAGEEPVVIGFDVAELGPDGRIRLVLGFIDKAPAA
jgi:SnoaL-like protein